MSLLQFIMLWVPGYYWEYLSRIMEEDGKRIAEPMDFYGQNLYNENVTAWRTEPIETPGIIDWMPVEAGRRYNYEIDRNRKRTVGKAAE